MLNNTEERPKSEGSTALLAQVLAYRDRLPDNPSADELAQIKGMLAAALHECGDTAPAPRNKEKKDR